ncbi:RAD21/Rec8 N-terminal domain protein [Mycena indigotica]|uniref:isopentenyl-diphosphate Delta-isomerase n=1 Tax=Mycena indigotica TaxID=2126181 RepID=A0A8H6SXG5_9AGAR|nr:RAD21/Rec8 N-terminal domain protein [Mycena indigotica]KAF7306915.1 RAD21/Rec8 N-terminal domain protein [Mycena indigotica]
MFFSSELLAKRDSGFGLLWLAATLGSKSTFKKLPKRSVLSADISQLCDLIADPEEPLALRLSSNLMIGVARVYKVKQEIFFSDVTSCVASLKKVVQEMKTASALDLQMAQPTARLSALNLPKDSTAGFLIDFDALVLDWDEFLNISGKNDVTLQEDDAEDEFNPNTKSKKQSRKAKASQPVEEHRGLDLHTLREDHEHLLSNSFELSFISNAGKDPSSSQAGGGFAMDDMFLSASDQLGIGEGLGDDLMKELGEGWGAFPDPINDPPFDGLANQDGFGAMDVDMNQALDFEAGNQMRSESMPATTPRKRKAINGPDKENIPPSSLRKQLSALSPATSFSRLFLSQDEAPLFDVTNQPTNATKPVAKKAKRTRLLLDARTELTDEELKTARAEYLKSQAILRRGIEQKRAEKDGGLLLEKLVWGAPRGLQAETLVEFWQENFKVQVEARTGIVSIHEEEEPPSKRRKIWDAVEVEPPQPNPFEENQMFEMQDGIPNMEDNLYGQVREPTPQRRSSEEPGQARHNSRPASVLDGRFEIEPQIPASGSQRSSLFPWDNAGGVSSSAGGGPMASDQISIDRADIKLRGGSFSRRESSLVPSQAGSVDGMHISIKDSHTVGEDYAFDVDAQMQEEVNQESQRSEMNLITLERNSYNFLEYVKMQLQGLPNSMAGLSFDTVVPMSTSTRHVAAAAFYHCLGLTVFRSCYEGSAEVLAAKAALASIDLSAYDPEQSRLMDERCILVDEQDNAIGAMDKKTCHLMENINKGLLHRAFSAFVFRPSDGKLLLQQRASEKITFPDMWTNTCCSHPLDDFEEEKIEQAQLGVRSAASRKLEHELGIPRSQTPIDNFQYLTRIHYLAPSNGIQALNNLLVDYILFITADVSVAPNLNEIRDYKYVDKAELQAMFDSPENSFTPWFKLIARDFLFGWWDLLLERKDANGLVSAKSLAGVADGSKVIKMV